MAIEEEEFGNVVMEMGLLFFSGDPPPAFHPWRRSGLVLLIYLVATAADGSLLSGNVKLEEGEEEADAKVRRLLGEGVVGQKGPAGRRPPNT
jgi:hypothetical protein